MRRAERLRLDASPLVGIVRCRGEQHGLDEEGNQKEKEKEDKGYHPSVTADAAATTLAAALALPASFAADAAAATHAAALALPASFAAAAAAANSVTSGAAANAAAR